jgi:hypothetical protein
LRQSEAVHVARGDRSNSNQTRRWFRLSMGVAAPGNYTPVSHQGEAVMPAAVDVSRPVNFLGDIALAIIVISESNDCAVHAESETM